MSPAGSKEEIASTGGPLSPFTSEPMSIVALYEKA